MDGDIAAADLVDEPPKPWGVWATLGLSLAVVVVSVAAQAVVAIVYVNLGTRVGIPQTTTQFPMSLLENGLLLSLAAWISLPFALGQIALFVTLRTGGPIKDYLAMRLVSKDVLFRWVGLLAAFMVVCTMSQLTGGPSRDAFMVRALETAWFPPLLWSTLVIAAPLFEETFFRGFMFRGIQESRLGGVGAVLITSLAWTLAHGQYGASGVLWIFLGGIFLGTARLKSGSIYLTMVLYAVWNLASLFKTMGT